MTVPNLMLPNTTRRLLAGLVAVAVCVCCLPGCGGGDEGGDKGAAPKTSGDAGKAAPEEETTGGDTAPSDEGQAAAEKPSKGGFGTLKGMIKFKGEAISLAPLIEQGADVKDKEVCAVEAVPNEALIVNAGNNGIANVFVYLRKAPKGAPDAEPGDKLVLDQKGCKFIPHALFVQTGQTVNAISSDGVAHNIHTYPIKNAPRNEIIQPNDQVGIDLNYTSAESLPIEVKCDIHSWMKSYQLILDHPYAAVTDENGAFEIPNLPAGKHEFVIWQESGGRLEKEYAVTIKGDDTTEVEIEFAADQFKVE